MKKDLRVAVIGGGKMGGVLIQGILAGKTARKGAVTVADKDRKRLDELKDLFGVETTTDNRKAAMKADVVILAVKPQVMAGVLGELKEDIGKAQLVVSIAAGIPIDFIATRLRAGIRIIRAMPNTPALCGEGATALAPGPAVTKEDMLWTHRMFDAVGLTVEVKEELMNAVTGLSGSGPAYGFVIIEALADAGVLMGLPRDLAYKLAAQTMLGAAKLFLSGNKHPGELKDMVTSPAGTTIAALQALEEGGLRATMMAAVEAATVRAESLSGK